MAITIDSFKSNKKFFGYDSTGNYQNDSEELGIHLYFSTTNKHYYLNVAPTSYTDNYTIYSQKDLPIGANKKIGTFLSTSRAVSLNFKVTKLLGKYKTDQSKNEKGEIVITTDDTKIVDDVDNSVSFIDEFAEICNPNYDENSIITSVPDVWLQVNQNKPVYGIATITRTIDLTSPIINGYYTTFDYSINIEELRN